MRFHPKDMYFYDVVPIPRVFHPALRADATLDDVWPLLHAEDLGMAAWHREAWLEELMTGFFREGFYRAAGGLPAFPRRPPFPKKTPRPPQNPNLYRTWRDQTECRSGLVAPDDASVFLQLLTRADLYSPDPRSAESDRWQLRRALYRFAEHAFGLARGAKVDLVIVTDAAGEQNMVESGGRS